MLVLSVPFPGGSLLSPLADGQLPSREPEYPDIWQRRAPGGHPEHPPPMTLALSQLATSHLQEGLAKAGQDDRRTPWKNWPIPRWI